MVRIVLMWVGLLLATVLQAEPLLPNSGLWWEEPVTGRFYAIEIAPSGKTYVVLSEFDAEGRPSWLALRGQLEVASEQEQAAGLPLARLEAPLLRLEGPCPGCPVASPVVAPASEGSALIVFTGNNTAEYRQGAIRRPLRHFAPADQLADYPAARLAGQYTLTQRSEAGRSSGDHVLAPATQAACTSYVGAAPPTGAIRLASACTSGACSGDEAGRLANSLELHVGPGAQPEIRAYRRGLAGERVPQQCYGYVGLPVSYCGCPAGSLWVGFDSNGEYLCQLPGDPAVCTETHRIALSGNQVRGLPTVAGQPEFVLMRHPF